MRPARDACRRDDVEHRHVTRSAVARVLSDVSVKVN